MPQAVNNLPPNLSPEQFAALQTVFTFLKSVCATLDVQNRPTTPDDVALTKAVRELGLYAIDRLLTAFPDLQKWAALSDGEQKQ